jgi:hypothetical protein
VTESEWLTCTNHIDLIRFIASQVSGRKLRLFAVECCRRQKTLFLKHNPRYWEAVEVAERYARGGATFEDLASAYELCDNNAHYEREPVAFHLQMAALNVAWRSTLGPPEHPIPPDRFAAETTPVCMREALYRLEMRTGTDLSARQICDAEHTAQLQLLREIVGNPFRTH